MAQRVHPRLPDAVDGSEATETLRFALDGVQYEIDLSEQHARELREALMPFVGVARRVGGGRSRRSGPGSGSPSVRRDPDTTRAIRLWAAANGHQVSERGRIPDSVIAAYDAAQ